MFESWSIEPLALPARSRLLPVAPFGLGTSRVESLSSYIRALGAAHLVGVSALVVEHVAPMLRPEPLATRAELRRALKRPLHDDPGIVDGPTPTAAAWAQALGTLTGKADLLQLTLAAWTEVLSPVGLRRPELVYCPACYEDFERDPLGVRQPLTWSLRGVTVCEEHSLRLRLDCPSCRTPLGSQSMGEARSICPRCGSDLRFGGVASAKVAGETDLAFANMAGRLVASSGGSPRRDRVVELVELAVESAGSSVALARSIRASKGQVSDWLRGKVLPTLENLWWLSVAADLDLVAHLTANDLQEPVGPRVEMARDRRAREPVSWERVEAMLSDATVEEPPPSLAVIYRRIGHAQRSIRTQFPELCAAIRARHKAWRADQTAARERAATVAVEQAVRDLTVEGKRPSRREVERKLGTLSIREPKVSRIWRETIATI